MVHTPQKDYSCQACPRSKQDPQAVYRGVSPYSTGQNNTLILHRKWNTNPSIPNTNNGRSDQMESNYKTCTSLPSSKSLRAVINRDCSGSVKFRRPPPALPLSRRLVYYILPFLVLFCARITRYQEECHHDLLRGRIILTSLHLLNFSLLSYCTLLC